MLVWCSLCNQRPSDGILEVLFEGDKLPTKLQACEICVMKIPDEGWLNEKNLNGKPVVKLDDFKVMPTNPLLKIEDLDFPDRQENLMFPDKD